MFLCPGKLQIQLPVHQEYTQGQRTGLLNSYTVFSSTDILYIIHNPFVYTIYKTHGCKHIKHKDHSGTFSVMFIVTFNVLTFLTQYSLRNAFLCTVIGLERLTQVTKKASGLFEETWLNF